MKRLITFVFCLFSVFILGQDASSNKQDDLSRIRLTAFLPENSGLSSEAQKILLDKMNQIVTKNGMTGGTANQRFIITANVLELTKDITPSTPPIYTYNLQVSFHIGNGIQGTKFASYSKEIKGSGKSEIKAYLAALKEIKTDEVGYQNFIQESKKRIVEYYKSSCDFELKEAKALEDMGNFAGAIQKLFEIPQVCTDCYDMAITRIGPIYQKQIDKNCKEDMSRASAAWSSSMDSKGAEGAGAYLSKIDPNSICYNDAILLYQEIAKRVMELNQREWDFKLKQNQDAVDLNLARINAARDIGVAYGLNQQPRVVYNIRGWW
jgi:hypothetical protein